MPSIALSVNLNKIALIRNSRDGNFPNLLPFAKQCLDLGAAGLTVHPRPDQRHIKPQDVYQLSELVQQTNAKQAYEFNIEGNPFAPALADYPGLLKLVEDTQPNQCTLVPDSHAQKTSDHGFDLKTGYAALAPHIEALKKLNVRISLFMDPDIEQIALAKKIGADRIELYTGPFAWAYENNQEEAQRQFNQHAQAAEAAHELGLGINAGHDLNLSNMQLYRTLPHLQEVSIGHALTVDALEMGYQQAVNRYIEICR